MRIISNTGNSKSPATEKKQIVPVSSDDIFELPEGWTVEVRPRHPNYFGISSDKYYYEPGTGRKFRSLVSIRRYLNGEEEISPRKRQSNCLVPYQNSGSIRKVAYGGKVLRLDELEEALHRNLDDVVPTTLQPKTSFVIPDGWIVEEVPRSSGLRSDRYFIEPVTGRKFRSVPDVHRYLSGEQIKRPICRALALSNHAKGPRSQISRKKNTSVKMQGGILDLVNPPERVNWVYSGDGKDNWSPLLDECVLPDYVKEQWAETFLLGMNGWKQPIPQLTMGGNNQASNA